MKSKQCIAIIDYGMGNIHSVRTAVQAVQEDQVEIICSHQIDLLRNADKLIFPGVGAMKDTMIPLKQQGLADVLPELLFSKPSLAICVGMQALAEFSEENQGVDCLAMVPARVKRFDPELMSMKNSDVQLKVPHIGWNRVKQRIEHPVWHKIPDESYFYFVHSYYLDLADKQLLAGTCAYGVDFPAAIFKGSLFATQFHPEKSDLYGLQLIRNFLAWNI